MRNGECFQRHPLGLGDELEFMEQARLAHAWFGHSCHDLAVPCASQFGRMPERLDFALAADKLSEPPRGCALKSRPQWSESRHLVDFDGLANTLHRRRAERFVCRVIVEVRQQFADK